MGEDPSGLDAWGTDGRRYERYASAAADALSSDGELRDGMEAWAGFVRASRGDVFDRLEAENPIRSAFIDTLYVDFVVGRAVQSIERRYGFELANPAASDNTDALPFEFRDLHESVVGEAADSRAWDADGLLELIRPASSASAFVRSLYERVVSDDLRRLLGEYYTPRGIADLSLAELEFADPKTEAVLDPGCGSGVFLAAAIEGKRAAAGGTDPAAFVAAVTDTVYGIDLNPVAVRTAKLTYLLALLPELGADAVDRVELPVFLTDALGLRRADTLRFRGEQFEPAVEHLVGNPPWLTWSRLPEPMREAWRGVEPLELFPHRGAEARLGHGNDDISVPFVWVCIHRYLVGGGDASFVLKRDIAKGPAGRLLRRQRVGSRPIAVRHVHDFEHLRPFDGADVGAAVYTIDADTEPGFPIESAVWRAGEATPEFSTVGAMRRTLEREGTGLVPVEPDDPASPWIDVDAERRALGACAHTIRHGVKDDATEVYTVDRSDLDGLEHDHVYPYLRSRHVVKYGLFGHDLHLVPITKAGEDNEARLRAEQPRTYAHLRSNRAALEDRSSAWLETGTFYNMFGLGPYTWADYKVVWCRLGFKPHFAVVSTVDDPDLGEKPVVPGDHCMFLPLDDEHAAHFLCGLLNSATYQRSIRGLASEGKASLSKAIVSELALPEYGGTQPEKRLAELSMAAHRIVPEYTDRSKRAYNSSEIEPLDAVQSEIDDLVERLLSTGTIGGDGQ
jgi:SAM-dependent methyltransferase